MLAEFIVMFREALEIALVVGIMTAYLHKLGKSEFEKFVYLGLGTGIIASVIAAYAFGFIQGGFEANEELFEGVFMVIAGVLVTWLILWMFEQKNIAENIKKQVQIKIDNNQKMGLVALAFFAVLREGVEIVLFMGGIEINTGGISVLGSILGLLAALIIGFLIIVYSKKINIGLFFKATSVILIFLAAGLFSQGVHELQEAGVLPTYVEHIYNINPPQNPDGTYPLLHEKGAIGSIFKGLVGYDGAPSLLQAISYIGYLAIVYGIYRLRYSK